MSLLPQPLIATDAVVLRTWPTGETSTIASLLTARCGFLRVLAKGARTGTSALRPLVQPGRLVNVECGHVAGRQLQYLRGGSVVLDPLATDGDLDRLACLLAAMELVDRCRPTGEHEDPLFALCRDFVSVLSSAPPARAVGCFYAFELSLLDLQGVGPELGACAVCGGDLGGQAGQVGGALGFAAAAGGVLCSSCVAGGSGGVGRPLARETLAALRALPTDGARARWAPARWVEREVGILLHVFLGYHLPAYRLPAALALRRAGGGPCAGEGGP